MSNKASNVIVNRVKWQFIEVTSPLLDHSVSVIVAKDIPYVANSNRLQNLSIYLPKTPETAKLIGTPVKSLPTADSGSILPRYHVHIHGGAWRDPQLTAKSIEPTVAHAFFATDNSTPIMAVASINYTVSQFPNHPVLPYDAIKYNHLDPSREAVHPQHISDVLHGLDLLRSFVVNDQSYILSGHSCGACIAFQTIFQSPAYYGLDYLPDAPAPTALIGLNGLYDLPNLVNGLDASHEHLHKDYEIMLSNAFGSDKDKWPESSPSRFDPATIAGRMLARKAPQLVLLDHSTEDQLVPMNQQEMFKANLNKVSELRLIEGHRCRGEHAVPWEQGLIIWQSIQDIFCLLQEENRV